MKTLVCMNPGTFVYQEGDMPEAGAGEALIRIKKIGICGTDLHAFEGTQPYFQYPRILGHELAAEFVSGDGEGFFSGETITIMPYFNCNNCGACLAGKPNCCVNLKVCGVHKDGGMAEYLVVPFSALVKGHGLTEDQLALVEPLSIGAHGLRRAGVNQGEFVLVMGAGPIGLGIMELAAIAGARVIALDVNEDRLKFCRSHLKTEAVLNALDGDIKSRIAEVTRSNMPAVVIDATGSQRAINTGFEYMAHGGRYVLVGLQKNEISFSHPEFHKREGTLMSSRNATTADFDYVISLIRSGKVDTNKFITHRLTFGSVRDQFASLLDPASGVVKALIEVQ